MSLPVVYKAPDGGWGWVIVVASFILQALSVGIAYTFGIIYVELLDFFKASRSSTAWIGSLQPALLYFICVITGPLLIKCGWRLVTIIGTVISSTGLFLSYFAPNIYVLFVTYGFLTGIGYGLMYMASMVIVQHYFDERRSLATGIAVSGSGMGTVVFGFVTTELLERFHWRITILVEGGITLVLGLLCAALIRPLPEEKDEIDPLLAEQIDPRLRAGSSYGTPGTSRTSSVDSTIASPESFITARDCVTSPPSQPSGDENDDDDDGENWTKNCDNDILEQLRSSTPPVKSLMSGNRSRRSSTPSPASTRSRSSQVSIAPMPTILDSEEHSHRSPSSSSPSSSCCASSCSCCVCCSCRSCAYSCNEKFRLSLLKNPILVIFCFSVICFCFGYHVPYTFTTERAMYILNIHEREAAALVSIMGIANLSSRLVSGCIGDNSARLRHFMLGAVILLCGILNSLTFLFTTFPLLIAYSVIFGILSGCFASLVPVVLVDQMGLELIEFTLGQVLASGSIAFLIASPMSGWIIQETGSYDAPFLVVGVAQIVGGFAFLLIPLARKCCPFRCHSVIAYDDHTIRRQRRRSRMFSESFA